MSFDLITGNNASNQIAERKTNTIDIKGNYGKLMEKLNGISEILGFIGGVFMPLFNIPLAMRIIRRKSADDISLVWLFGVWLCILCMVPSSLATTNRVLKGFGISNAIFFTMVVGVVMVYRKKL